MAHIAEAQKEKQTEQHNVIDEAYAVRGEDYTVFSIPVGVVYRPSANKLNNLKTKNYLGTAKLVAATDTAEAFTGFSGSERLQRSASSASSSEPANSPPLVRRGTAAARIEGTGSTSPTVELRRRPTDNTVAFAPSSMLARSISASAAGPRPARPTRKESLRAVLRPVQEDRPAARIPASPDQIGALLDRYRSDSAPSSPSQGPGPSSAERVRFGALGSARQASRALQNAAFTASPSLSHRRTPSPPSTDEASPQSAGPFRNGGALSRVRIKLYHGLDTRGMVGHSRLSLTARRADARLGSPSTRRRRCATSGTRSGQSSGSPTTLSFGTSTTTVRGSTSSTRCAHLGSTKTGDE